MRILYDLFLSLWVLFQLPRMFFRRRKALLQRFNSETPQGLEDVVWFHAVSLGESKAAIPMIEQAKKNHPDAKIVLSTMTLTGLDFAKSQASIDHAFLLPPDLSFCMKLLVSRLKPRMFILVESDFWLNLLIELKRVGATVVLVNGKLSTRSFSRLLRVPFFSKKLFGSFDLLCNQESCYTSLFERLGVEEGRLRTTGNIKYDIQRPSIGNAKKKAWQQKHNPNNKLILTLGCTHEGEEEMLLDALEPFLSDVLVLVAPRHPERFEGVRGLVPSGVILIDQMGMLDFCYSLSDIVILGGSFVTGVGGHNLFEPLEGRVALLFGPNMNAQQNMTSLVLEKGAGAQVFLQDLQAKVGELLESRALREEMQECGIELVQEMKGSSERTWREIEKVVARKDVLC